MSCYRIFTITFETRTERCASCCRGHGTLEECELVSLSSVGRKTGLMMMLEAGGMANLDPRVRLRVGLLQCL
jgi:hypothetical protein